MPQTKNTPIKPRRVLKIFGFTIGATALIVIGAGLIAALLMYIKISAGLPDVDSLKNYQPSLTTKLYDSNDKIFAEYFIENRVFVPLAQIPRKMIETTLAVEDSDFYTHRGIDFSGILRAMLANIRAGGIVQGGSTITQQVAKQMFLTSERTYIRKIREVLLAFQIERAFAKDEILEIYLNQIYYGHGAYGVEAAAKTYFGKHVQKLGTAEIALIAGLPKAPSGYSPYTNPQRAKARRAHVLERMLEQKIIDRADYEKYLNAPFDLINRGETKYAAPYYAEHIRRYLEAKYDSTTLYRGGLQVYTTLDSNKQAAAEKAVRDGIENLDMRIGYHGPHLHVDLGKGERPDWDELNQDLAWKRKREYEPGDRFYALVTAVDKDAAVVETDRVHGTIPVEGLKWAHGIDPKRDAKYVEEVKDARNVLHAGDVVLVEVTAHDAEDPKTGWVFALRQDPVVQGGLVSIEPSTGYVRALVGGYDYRTSEFNRATQATRQPGSAFKPVIYTAAFARGLTPATVIVDSPIIYNDTLEAFRNWKPMNFEEKFYGPTRLREAVTHSRNIVTIKVLQQITPDFAVEIARQLGIVSPIDPTYSLALGSYGVTLLELTSVYGVFANNGVRNEPVFIRMIKDRDGNILEQHEPAPFEVIPPELAYVTTSVLKSVVSEGTGQAVQELGRPIAAKTGTTNENVDAWFVGYIPELVTGVWVGKDAKDVLGRNETGSRAASPIWLEYMKEAVKDVPATDFPVPPGVTWAKIDKATGLLAPEGAEDTIDEVFIAGTEPKAYAPAGITGSTDFMRHDREF